MIEDDKLRTRFHAELRLLRMRREGICEDPRLHYLPRLLQEAAGKSTEEVLEFREVLERVALDDLLYALDRARTPCPKQEERLETPRTSRVVLRQQRRRAASSTT